MKDRWIIVPKWERFQSYKARDPSWIKLYTRLNSHDEWLGLSTAARGMLTTIWVEYPRSGGLLRVEKVMQLCGKSARSKHLEALNHAGFIEISSSKPRGLTRARARSREEEVLRTSSKERASRAAVESGTAAPAKKETDPRERAERWIANTADELAGLSDEHLRYLLADEFKITDPDVLSTLVNRVRETYGAELAERQFQDELEAAAEEINF